MDYDDKMKQAFELIGGDEKSFGIRNVLNATHVFKEIYDHVQNVSIYIDAKPEREHMQSVMNGIENLEDRVMKIWYIFCERVVHAPTSIHVIGCVVLIIPVLYENILKYNNENDKASHTCTHQRSEAPGTI